MSRKRPDDPDGLDTPGPKRRTRARKPIAAPAEPAPQPTSVPFGWRAEAIRLGWHPMIDAEGKERLLPLSTPARVRHDPRDDEQ